MKPSVTSYPSLCIHCNNTKKETIFLAVVELESAMEMAEDAFEAKYGLKKPTKTTPIITHCTKGGRARKAGDLLKSIGYNARYVYLRSLHLCSNGRLEKS